MSNWEKPFWRSVFSEDDGTGSASRLCIVAIVVSALGWVTYVILKHQLLPDLGGLTVFVTSVGSSLYGINKLGKAMLNKFSQPDPPEAPKP